MFHLSPSDNFTVPLVIAIALALIVLVQLYVAIRRSTLYALSLTAIGLSMAGYAVLMIPPVEEWLTATVGIRAISPLLKDVFLFISLVSVSMVWGKINVPRKVSIPAQTLVFIMPITAYLSWISNRALCAFETTPEFQACAQAQPLGFASQLYTYFLVLTFLIITVIFMWSIIGPHNPEKTAGRILFSALVATILWTATATVGVFEVFYTGELGPDQYLLRTPLGLLASLLWMTTVIYLPAQRIVTAMLFRRWTQPLMEKLSTSKSPSLIFGDGARYTVTDAMDALRFMLHKDGVEIVFCESTDPVSTLVAYLEGRELPTKVGLPAAASTSVQRAWLVMVSRELQKTRKGAHEASSISS
ncbi:hypothetical protein [Corynebacterium crudilactis]|uniref:Uncharacterized protein n=1 Tax=Corynebacterium crudilactis TaxID=1652495 RepID=A0A172QXW0_9CORY|nr:hypothetical protein [Corynebacterium crudilactis]ANE05481.1 hypothetical protein ccrud_14160 [Corynebacterium crudilactis]